jgi:prepilin-type N-terminal cleavage/methylation domain-containing protein
MRMEQKRPAGFTLIELLIVIAIIGILVALMIPTLASAKESANRVVCKSNLKQMHAGIHLYANTFGKLYLYPPHDGTTFLECLRGRCGGNHPSPWTTFAPLRNQHDVFVCPSTGNIASETALDYKGPGYTGLPYNWINDSYPRDRPIVGDGAVEHHKSQGGNILRFDGAVQFYDPSSYETVVSTGILK